jgi:hypothetical protein
LSPQSRRGRAAPPSHRKSASHAASQAARKPAPQVEAVEPVEDEEPEEARPLPNKREGKPVRRKRTLAKARKSAFARYGGEWVKAYAPLFAVAIVGFFALWAWVSFGPHTPTPKENWQRIESAWKPKRDADLQKVSAAVAANDLQAELTAYKSLRDDTQGWMDALNKIPDWGSAAATPAPGQTENAIQAMSAFTADGQTIAAALDNVVKATTPNDILGYTQTLLDDEQAFQTDFWTARMIVTGSTEAAPSTLPTFPLPPGTYVPSPSPGASGSPGTSASPAVSPSATASGTPAPS